MNPGRTLRLAALLIACAAGAAQADYPEKPVTMLVPYGAGGVTDVTARLTAKAMEGPLGETVVVSNKTGAAGTIGLTTVARARPDGYTILMTPSAPLIIQPHLRKLQYDLDSFTWICGVFDSPIVLATGPDSDIADFADALARAKAAPDTLTFGSAGAGSLPHVSMVRLLASPGVAMKHVPMQGDAGAVTGTLGGHTDLAAVAATSVIGKGVRTLAVLEPETPAVLGDAPTAAAAGIEAHYSLWGGLLGPKDMPAEAVATLSAACREATASPEFAEEMAKMAAKPAFLDAAGFKALAQSDSAANGKVLGDLGMAGN